MCVYMPAPVVQVWKSEANFPKFSPFTLWVPRIKHQPSVLVVSTFICYTIISYVASTTTVVLK